MSTEALVLASRSPRRRELLALLGLPFTVCPAAVDETPRPAERPESYVLRTARDKAAAVSGRAVLAADTAVVADGLILGKPRDGDHAREMLERLSGRRHLVHTGVVLRCEGQLRERRVSTAVAFAPLDERQLQAYLAGDEPWDKAGAYGIQGAAAAFVRAINGSYSNVVGLPLVETRELLLAAGLLPGAGGAEP